MDVTADLDAPCSAHDLYPWVEDLTRYPQWLSIVARAVPEDRTEPDGTGHGPAWSVDLRGRIGPLARSKRLRMVRTGHEADRLAVFERRELDGRAHSPWVLRAEVTSHGDGSRLTMRLHYGGGLWAPVLERLLGDEIGRSRTRLLSCVAADEAPEAGG